ncbi:hypothetical protein IC1_05715 [Bacillus cereus VD022]|uniref:1-phosphatidylinositol phosphodiesterase n=1 Tax=Bacillus cereus TIAC219 TaxID=718222 RepID=A0ABC9SRX5_BACCE|nr:hypothetical protein IC1_05715 [Bacillus cereus VD022]EOQ58660.1 hypothetical protein IAY_05829 [Bacillus cereus TIAC219]
MLNNKNFLVSIIVLLAMFSTFFDSKLTFADTKKREIDFSKWMEHIPDSKTLAEMSIPGTHDSGTFKLSEPITAVWAQTQEHDFSYQMNHGIRFFDIRGRVTDDNTIVLHHGSVYLRVTLWEFINKARSFLKSYPSETIIMSLKEDYDPMPGAKDSFVNTFEEHYFGDPIFLKKQGKITLGDARGKIVLFRRYTGSEMTGGFPNFWWKDNATFNSSSGDYKLTVQDKYNENYDTKKNAIEDMLEKTVENESNPNHIHINFTSLASGGTAWNSAYYYASYLNSDTATKVRLKNLLFPGSKAGWVIMDYVGDRWDPKLYEEVIRANFNDKIYSPQFFEHIDAGGRNLTNLPHSQWNDQVSSIILPGHTQITIYEHANYTGDSFVLGNYNNQPKLFNLTSYNFNDKMSAYEWKRI